MYILKNSFRCIFRAKGRNILIGLVVLLLSVSSCIGLSIRQANKSIKKQYSDSYEILATLRPQNMRENGNISLDTLTDLANDNSVKNFYYSSSIYFAAGENITPLDVSGSFKQNKDFKEKFGDIKSGHEETVETTATGGNYNIITLSETENTEEKEKSEDEGPVLPNQEEPNENGQNGQSKQNNTTNNTPPSPPEMQDAATFITNKYFFNMASMNDFTVVGLSDNNAVPDYITELNVLNTGSQELNCVISKNLADHNSIEVGSTFSLKNPNNSDEAYEFTVVGICDTSKSNEQTDTSSNASFTDNYIYVSGKAVDRILSASIEANPTTSEEEQNKTLKASYNGTFIFSNLNDYNTFKEKIDDAYTLVSEDIENYEKSVSQLETLGKYATYFLIVIFIIGSFVLIIINLFSIRNRKYEIGVLTAIGMKKKKVALQFVIELFAVTFAALIIGSSVGAAVSVPVTNNLLITINKEENTKQDNAQPTPPDQNDAPQMPNQPNQNDSKDIGERMGEFKGAVNNYIAQVSSATDFTVIFEMIIVGIGLTLISSAAAIAFIMRYEPLKILSNRD